MTIKTQNPPKTAVQIGLDVILITSIITLFLALFVPQTRIEWMAILPFIIGTLITTATLIERKIL